MYQVRLKTDFCGHEKCTFKESEEMSRRYQREFINAKLCESVKLKHWRICFNYCNRTNVEFLRNANIQVTPYSLGIGQLMFVDSDGGTKISFALYSSILHTYAGFGLGTDCEVYHVW